MLAISYSLNSNAEPLTRISLSVTELLRVHLGMNRLKSRAPPCVLPVQGPTGEEAEHTHVCEGGAVFIATQLCVAAGVEALQVIGPTKAADHGFAVGPLHFDEGRQGRVVCEQACALNADNRVVNAVKKGSVSNDAAHKWKEMNSALVLAPRKWGYSQGLNLCPLV